MAELTKESLLFERDEKGELIQKDVVLELLPGKPSVRLKPLTRGTLQRIRIKAVSDNPDEKVESDNDVIKAGLVKPALTDEEIKNIKPQKANAIIMAIIATSLDMPQTEVNKDMDKALKAQEIEIKKKT